MGQEFGAKLLGWLPLIVIAGLWIAYSRTASRKYDGHVMRVEKINDRLVEGNSEIISELREIKQILRDRA